MRSFTFGGLLLVCAAAGACGTDDSTPVATAELPVGWEGARRVEVTQQPCSGSPYEGADERASFLATAGRLEVVYTEAHFRCEQPVEAFLRQSPGVVDVLVQPVDMDPKSVAMCDCLYDVDVAVAPLAAGTYQATAYRRWDNLNEPNDPLEIATGSVRVP